VVNTSYLSYYYPFILILLYILELFPRRLQKTSRAPMHASIQKPSRAGPSIQSERSLSKPRRPEPRDRESISVVSATQRSQRLATTRRRSPSPSRRDGDGDASLSRASRFPRQEGRNTRAITTVSSSATSGSSRPPRLPAIPIPTPHRIVPTQRNARDRDQTDSSRADHGSNGAAGAGAGAVHNGRRPRPSPAAGRGMRPRRQPRRRRVRPRYVRRAPLPQSPSPLLRSPECMRGVAWGVRLRATRPAILLLQYYPPEVGNR
jgi:hypothetical protein